MCSNVIEFTSENIKATVAHACLQQTTDEDLFRKINDLFVLAPDYNRELLASCLASIESRNLLDSPGLSPYLADGSIWRRIDIGIWLVARLLDLRSETASALGLWNSIIDRQIGEISEALLARARLYGKTGDIQQAFSDIRNSLQNKRNYTFLLKVAKFYQRLRQQAIPKAVKSIRLAYLSSTTTDFITQILQVACFREGIDIELYTAPYGAFRQDVLNPNSGLFKFKPDFVIIATNWRDANLPWFVDNPTEQIMGVVDEFNNLWKILLQRLPCRVIQYNFDLPDLDPYGHLSLSMDGGRLQILRQINQRLAKITPPSVAVLDLDHVSAKFGKKAWFDAPYWHIAKQYPAHEALPILVDHNVALIRAGLGLNKKVLVLDLDNTLWGGVIGEDGLDGIKLGSSSPEGESFKTFQHYVLGLKERGVLLAVCSKNNESDAKLPFQMHDETVLHLDDFVIFIANWIDKPTNLRQIAAKLNLGIDSFVFLDDNPVERALVRRELPDVAVPEVGSDPVSYVEALDRGLYFEALTLSEEDKERHKSYKANFIRDELAINATSVDDFLKSLQMVAEVGPFSEHVLPRIVQLIGKTNQFNLTTRRYSEEQVRQMISRGNWTQYFRLRDRFGDNGLVGVMIARQIPGDKMTLEIDTWLMSCRVIGRRMEEFMLQTLIEAANTAGVSKIKGVYIQTAKNLMVSDFYDRMGFKKIMISDAGVFYELDLNDHTINSCKFIKRGN